MYQVREIEYVKNLKTPAIIMHLCQNQEKLLFSISNNIEKGIQEILFLIKNKVITNSDTPLYKNNKMYTNNVSLFHCMIYDNCQPFIIYERPSIRT